MTKRFYAAVGILAMLLALIVPAAAAAAQPPEEGEITVLKRFCEEDNSDNENSNCNGRVEDAEGETVTFTVTDDGGNEVGTIEVEIGQQGNGSQGQASLDGLDAEGTFTVCEEPFPGFDAVPRPGSQGGSNQTAGEGDEEDCIIVELGPGNNVLQFDNFPTETTTETETETETATETVTETETETATETETVTETETATETETETETVTETEPPPVIGEDDTGGTTTGGTTTGGTTTGGTTTGGTTGVTVTDLPDTGSVGVLERVDYRVAWLAFAAVVTLALAGAWLRHVATQPSQTDRD